MSCIIRKIPLKELTLYSNEWDLAETVSISNANWSEFPKKINTDVKLLYNENGIYVKFICDEYPIHISHTRNGDHVYLDSAVEFFIAPDINDNKYFNFEINAAGYIRIGYGPGRERRFFSDIDFNRFKVNSEITVRGFKLMVFLPFSFMKEYASNLTRSMKGNLQKCCETEGNIHFLSAFPIKTEVPDFHSPDFFQEFILE